MRAALRACLVPAVLAGPLGACSGDVVRTLAADAGYGPKIVAAPDFVANSRPKETPDFMAVGVDAPRRAVRPKNAEGQKALAADLEAARGRNESRGHAAESAGKGVAKGVEKVARPPAAEPATPSPQ